MPSLTRSLAMFATYPHRRWLASRPPPRRAPAAAAKYLLASDRESGELVVDRPERSAPRRSKDA